MYKKPTYSNMKQKIALTILAVFMVSASIAQNDFTKYIDPTIGNVAQFLVPTYPTMHLPNQMIRMFPVKQDYISDQVTAFPLQVYSHRTAGILQMKVTLGEVTETSWKQKMNIDHDLEIIHPWLYSTYLIDDNIKVSFTPASKCAVYRIDFPESEKKNILIQGSADMKSKVNAGSLAFQETIKYTTKGVNPVTRMLSAYFYARITDSDNKPIEGKVGTLEKGKFSISFAKNTPSVVYIKYGVSYISPEQAEINFNKELANASFDDLVASGKKQWEKVINQIEVEGGTEAQKRTFYTSLYRTYERMIDINEGGRYYSGYDCKVHESDRPFFVDDWIWDTYRAQHPLRTILDPEMENEVLNSYTLMYEQSGWMPTFPQLHGNHQCMNSYHSSAIFIDGYRKGLRNYDVEKAYEGIKKNLTEATLIPWRQGNPKRAIDDFYHQHGYFPALRPGQKETETIVDSFEKRQAVAVTLGISYNAWNLAEFAKELKKEADYKRFSVAAKNYTRLWHPTERLFMPKDDQGEWIAINPKLDGGPGYREYYDENNGWTYAWEVQHDVEGLTQLLGGKKAAENRLDQLFREPLDIKKFHRSCRPVLDG
jgi:predicted alpha-1,2-mannosidase